MNRATLLSFILAGALSLGLFFLKYEVHGLESELDGLRRAIIADRQALHVLKAEWSHLNDPHRLKGLAQRHLELVPVEPRQVGTLELLPPADGSVAPSAGTAPPSAPGRIAASPGTLRP